MDDETIQQDVSEVNENTVDTPEQPEETIAGDPLSKREAKMKSLQDKRKEERERDKEAALEMNMLQRDVESREERELEGAEEELPDNQAEIVTAATEDAQREPSIPSPEKPKTRQLKVNGRMVEMTEEQYEAALQKDLSGDEKLRQAAEAARVLLQREQRLAERERQQAQMAQPPQDEGAVMEEAKAAAKEALEKLLEGDTDQATDKLTQALIKARAPSVDVNSLKAQLKNEVKAENAAEAQQRRYHEDFQKFSRDYQDVVGDPALLAYADVKLREIRANPESANLTPEEQFRKAGEMTRKVFQQAKPTVTASEDSERMKRKENLKPIPKAKGVAKAKKEEPKMDTSPSAAIARMRQTRAMRA